MKLAFGFTRTLGDSSRLCPRECTSRFCSVCALIVTLLLAAVSPAQAQWQSRDIGTTTAGSTTVAGNSVTIAGSGRDIWNEQDGFRFYYRELTGEVEAIVRVRSLENTYGWAKAGIMARATTDPGSPHHMICVSAVHGTAFQFREVPNGTSYSHTPTEDGGPPRWLRLRRVVYDDSPRPDAWEYRTSLDGINWSTPTLVPTSGVGPFLLGLAVTSHNDGVLSRAEFDQFSLIFPPAPASGVRVVSRGPDGRMDLAWTDNSIDETGFIIQAAPGLRRGSEYETIGQVGANVTTFSATGLSPGTYYTFRIRAVNGAVGSYSSTVMEQTTPAVTVTAWGSASDAITARISEGPDPRNNLNGPDGGPYALERSTDGSTWAQIASGLSRTGGAISMSTTDYVDRAVTPGASYYYRARYLEPDGDSGSYSAPAGPVTTTSTPSGPPAAPTNLTAVGISATEIRLHWTDNAGNETDYVIRRVDPSTGQSVQFSVGPNQTSRSDSGLTPSRNYSYVVWAVNASGSSAVSNTATGGTYSSTPGLAPPSQLTASAQSSTQIFLSWTDNSTADIATIVERSTDGMNFQQVAAVNGAVTNWTDNGRDPATTFYYRVRATTGSEESAHSNIASATTPPATPGGGVPAPSNLIIGAYSTEVAHLSWTDNAGDETGFEIERALGAGSFAFARVAIVAANVVSYFDGGLTPGTTYRYRVRAVRNTTFSDYSNIATVTTTIGWTSSDIGQTGAAGSTSGSGTTRTMNASGADIWNNSDSFHFHYMQWSGLGEFYVRVTSLQYTHGWAKAGVMIRQALTPDSPHAFMLVSAGNGTALQWRSTYGGATQSSSAGALSSSLPVWLKLTRNANTLVGYESSDGVNWRTVGQVTINLANTVYIGLAATSHNSGVLTRADFDNLNVGGSNTPDTTAPTQPTNLAATASSSSQINLQWADNSNNETGFVLETSSDNANFGFLARVGANVTTYTHTGLSPATTYYYRMYAENGTVLSPRTASVSATTFAAPPPNPQTWTDTDIGAVAAAGSGSGSGTSAQVSGSGNDIWENSDEFHYRHQPWTGDGVFITRVASMTNTHGWAKAGIMLRENLTPTSRHVFVAVNPNNAGALFARSTTGGATDFAIAVYEIPSMWLKLERSGNVFRAYQSSNGTEWTAIGGPATLALPSTLYAGLAVTSHADGALCTASFQNISFTGGATPPPPPPPEPPPSTWDFRDIGAVGLAGSNSSGTASITISASGADIWGRADAFRFVYRSLTGDGIVDARVDSLQNTNVWAKAGVMIRETLAADARNVFAFVTPVWNGAGAQIRSTVGGETSGVAGPMLNPPAWVRLQRQGSTIIAFTATDGRTWTEITRWTVSFGPTLYFGFAVTSHNNSQLTTAVFSEPWVR